MTAMDEVFEANRDRIRRYILGMVHDPAEAEDLAQETFLRAHSKQDTLRDPNAARGWLYRIATHICLDRLRQRVPVIPLDSDGVEPATAQRPLLLELAERAQTSACVQKCLDYLSDSDRAILLLYEAESLTAPEIAALLGGKLATIKARLLRARRKLQFVMELGCAVSHSAEGVPCCEPKPLTPRPR